MRVRGSRSASAGIRRNRRPWSGRTAASILRTTPCMPLPLGRDRSGPRTSMRGRCVAPSPHPGSDRGCGCSTSLSIARASAGKTTPPARSAPSSEAGCSRVCAAPPGAPRAYRGLQARSAPNNSYSRRIPSIPPMNTAASGLASWNIWRRMRLRLLSQRPGFGSSPSTAGVQMTRPTPASRNRCVSDGRQFSNRSDWYVTTRCRCSTDSSAATYISSGAIVGCIAVMSSHPAERNTRATATTASVMSSGSNSPCHRVGSGIEADRNTPRKTSSC